MMNRRNQILTAVLVLQLVVAIVLWPRPATSGGEGASLFPGIEANQIVAMTIAGTDGESIQLAKDAGDWVLPEADDYPIQADKVTTLLSKIVGLKADRLVTQTNSSHKRLKVAENDFERRVEFELADGSRHVLYIGTSPSFGVAHVRADGQDGVYLAPDLSAQDAGCEARDYVDQVYFSVPRDDVVAFALENKNGRFEFERVTSDAEGEETQQWTMRDLAPEETLDETSISTLFNRAVSVSMLHPLGKTEEDAYGMQAPNAVLTIQTQSEEGGDRTYTLRVGAKEASDNTYVVSSSESAYYVRVNEFTVKDFVEKTRDDFLELPPTPTPAPEETPEAGPEATPGGM
jgi:hypothetical protein